jgi:hypothetical protein
MEGSLQSEGGMEERVMRRRVWWEGSGWIRMMRRSESVLSFPFAGDRDASDWLISTFDVT